MSKTLVLDREETRTELSPTWQVILFNCQCHNFEEVIIQLMKCNLTQQQAEWCAMEAHAGGRTIPYEGEKAEAEKVYGILHSIQLQVELRQR